MDEFALSGLTPLASDLVKPPRVAESKAQMECRLLQIVPVSDRPGGGILVLGEVLRFHVLDSLLDGYKIDPDKLNAIGRMGGPTYVRTHDRFDMRTAEVTRAHSQRISFNRMLNTLSVRRATVRRSIRRPQLHRRRRTPRPGPA